MVPHLRLDDWGLGMRLDRRINDWHLGATDHQSTCDLWAGRTPEGVALKSRHRWNVCEHHFPQLHFRAAGQALHRTTCHFTEETHGALERSSCSSRAVGISPAVVENWTTALAISCVAAGQSSGAERPSSTDAERPVR